MIELKNNPAGNFFLLAAFLKDYRKKIQTADAVLEDGTDQAVIQGKELKVVTGTSHCFH